MSRRPVDIVVNGEVEKSVVVKYLITFFDLSTREIESSLALTQLYDRYENAMTIEEVD